MFAQGTDNTEIARKVDPRQVVAWSAGVDWSGMVEAWTVGIHDQATRLSQQPRESGEGQDREGR
jgi:hypothetical protein